MRRGTEGRDIGDLDRLLGKESIERYGWGGGLDTVRLT